MNLIKNNNLSLIIFYFILFIKKTIMIDYEFDTGSNNPNDQVGNILDDDIISNITTGYNTLVRPSPLVNISLRVSLRQIVSVDVQNQIITTNLYLALVWLDRRLKWPPQLYGNLQTILIPTSKIWVPDLAIMNTASGNGFVSISSSNLAVLNNIGIVYIIINVAGLQTRCKMNVMKYPFDVQICSIVIGSWQHDTGRINFQSDESKIDLTNYISNPVWTLQKVIVSSVLSNSRYIQALNLFNEDISYQLYIKRGPLYIMINNVYPVLILNAVTLMAFFLPFATQVTLSMTTFLTYGVYSVRTSSDLPIQSEYFPLISIYFFLAIIYTFISLGWFLLANQIASKNKIPIWLKPIIFLLSELKSVLKLKRSIKSKTTVNVIKNNENDSVQNAKLNKEALNENGFIKIKKCFKCESCDECINNKEKENEKKKTKEAFDDQINTLNLFVFFCVLFIILLSNLVIWIQISF